MYKHVIVSEEHYKILKKNARLCKKTIRDYFNDSLRDYLKIKLEKQDLENRGKTELERLEMEKNDK